MPSAKSWGLAPMCFPETYKKILSGAYYLILEDRNPLSRFSKWARPHVHPFGKDLPSQRSSELVYSIEENAKNEFFRLQCARLMARIASISVPHFPSKFARKEGYWFYEADVDTWKILTTGGNSSCIHKMLQKHQQISAIFFNRVFWAPFYYRKVM